MEGCLGHGRDTSPTSRGADSLRRSRLAELDRQIAELQSRRSAFATKLSQEFESNKSCLTEYAANAKRAEQLKMNEGVRQAEIIMGEVRWLELKAFLKTVLPTSP